MGTTMSSVKAWTCGHAYRESPFTGSKSHSNDQPSYLDALTPSLLIPECLNSSTIYRRASNEMLWMTENGGLTAVIIILIFWGRNNGRFDLIKFSSRFARSNYCKLIGAYTLNTIDTKVGLKGAWTIRVFVSTVMWSMALWLLVCLQNNSVNSFKLLSCQAVLNIIDFDVRCSCHQVRNVDYSLLCSPPGHLQ